MTTDNLFIKAKFKDKICDFCSKRTIQQFKDLFHCKCGVSYIKRGKSWRSLARTGDMVFKLNNNRKAIIELPRKI